MVRQELSAVRAAVVLAHRAVDASQVILAMVRCKALGADRYDLMMPDGSVGEPEGERQALYGAAVRWADGVASRPAIVGAPWRRSLDAWNLGLVARDGGGFEFRAAPADYQLQVALALVPGLAPHLTPDQADILHLMDSIPAAAGAVAAGALCRTAYAAVAVEVLPLLVAGARERAKAAAAVGSHVVDIYGPLEVPDGAWPLPVAQSTAVSAEEKAAVIEVDRVARAGDILRAAGAGLIRENSISDGGRPFCALQWWATRSGCIVLQIYADGGISHYCEGGAKWEDLEADVRRMQSAN